jgi:hypothetical protein
MTEHTMPEQVYDALRVFLNEFECDLEPRLNYFAKGDDSHQEYGRQILRAFDLVATWWSRPNMDPDEIRKSLEYSDWQWGEWIRTEAA